MKEKEFYKKGQMTKFIKKIIGSEYKVKTTAVCTMIFGKNLEEAKELLEGYGLGLKNQEGFYLMVWEL